METLFIPTEAELKKWVKEAVQECMNDLLLKQLAPESKEETLLNRKEVAQLLRISLVTLTDWMKRGLPYHKQRGRVYFLYSEVMGYIQKNHFQKYFESV